MCAGVLSRITRRRGGRLLGMVCCACSTKILAKSSVCGVLLEQHLLELARGLLGCAVAHHPLVMAATD